MKLAIFDIDGTLTNTNRVDGECFVQAFADAHNITDIETDWSKYPHTTDAAIALHVFQQRWGRAPNESESTALKDRFESLLDERHSTDATLFAEIPGASVAIGRLQDEAIGWAVAIATGCWAASAELKLAAADIRVSRLKIATAEDNLSREKIVEAAVSKALAFYHQGSFEKIVSIGDGVWDVRTARNLNFAFLGIGSGVRETTLRAAGATHVIADFHDFVQVLRSLDEAMIPEPEELD